VLTFLQPRPGVVAVARLAPEDGHRAAALHEGQRVAVHVDQLLRLHVVGDMAVCVHAPTLVAHAFDT